MLSFRQATRLGAIVLFLFTLFIPDLLAQSLDPPPVATTMFSRSDDAAWWVSGQLNLIAQAHGDFPARYSGPNSLQAASEHAVSRVMTLYTGARLPRGWEVFLDIESAGGNGLSSALGLAGFTNLDVVRNPTLGSAPYVGRAMVRKVFALSGDHIDVTPSPFGIASHLPSRRIEVRVGKMSVVDFFDTNVVGSDSHLQFTNWAVDNNAAYDYAADTRGYTNAAIVEYDAPRWALRGALALMPTVANGLTLDRHINRARGQNVELELMPAHAWKVRLLAYSNHANMGNYDEAIAAYRDGRDARPDIERHRALDRVKVGFGANTEYVMKGDVRVFGRGGWNRGDTESFAYTEANTTIALGADVAGRRWRRPIDRAGVAFVSNGLSTPHREYLRLGGLGFLLGDGSLSYGREAIVESYYTAHLWRGVSASVGADFIDHPGYNRDRGPVRVGSARVHVDF